MGAGSRVLMTVSCLGQVPGKIRSMRVSRASVRLSMRATRLSPAARARAFCAACRSAAVGLLAAVFLLAVLLMAVFLTVPVEPLNRPPLSRLTRCFMGAALRAAGAGRGAVAAVTLTGRGVPVIERGVSGPAAAR